MGIRAIFFSAFVALAAHGLAQTDFDRQIVNIRILESKPIQAEIGITAAQRAQMNVAADAHRQKIAAYEKELQRTHAKPDGKRIFGFFVELRKKVVAQLTAPQLKRLRELTLQSNGLASLADSAVAKRVGLSASQLKTIRSAIESDHKAIASIEESVAKPILARYRGMKPSSPQQGKALEEKFHQEMTAASNRARPRLEAIVKKDRAKVLGALSPAQKATWQALLGKPFRPQR